MTLQRPVHSVRNVKLTNHPRLRFRALVGLTVDYSVGRHVGITPLKEKCYT